jgi:hypothetical protein
MEEEDPGRRSAGKKRTRSQGMETDFKKEGS